MQAMEFLSEASSKRQSAHRCCSGKAAQEWHAVIDPIRLLDEPENLSVGGHLCWPVCHAEERFQFPRPLDPMAGAAVGGIEFCAC